MIKYSVDNVEEISWFSDPPEEWDEEKRFIPETIQKLKDAGVIDTFMLDHAVTTDNGDCIVDMESVYEDLRHNSDDILKKYIGEKITCIVSGIEWDTDGEEVDLPSEVSIEVEDDDSDDDILDKVSDEYGWLIISVEDIKRVK